MTESLEEDMLSWEISRKLKIKKIVNFFAYGLAPLYFFGSLLLTFYVREYHPRRMVFRIPRGFNIMEASWIYLIGFLVLLAILLLVLVLVYIFSPDESYILNNAGITKTRNRISKKYSWSELTEFYSYNNPIDLEQCTGEKRANGNVFVKVSPPAINYPPIFDSPIYYVKIKNNDILDKRKHFLEIKALSQNNSQVIMFLNRYLSVGSWDIKSKGFFSRYE